MCKLRAKDEKMLEMLISHDVVEVAMELSYENPNGLYQQLFRLRQRKIQAQEFVNKLNSFANRSPRLRKFLTSAQIKNLEG